MLRSFGSNPPSLPPHVGPQAVHLGLPPHLKSQFYHLAASVHLLCPIRGPASGPTAAELSGGVVSWWSLENRQRLMGRFFWGIFVGF